jgi:hypothetical protein
MNTKLKTLLTLGIFFLLTAQDVTAQVSLGADIVNRYVWRGADFGNSPSIQPDINYSSGGFEIGTWAAFATNGNPAGTEVDFYASYTFDTDAGSFQLMLTDYTFPQAPEGNYFQSSSHFLEGGVGYGGTEKFPVSFFTGMFFTNDDDYSIYSEIGYSFKNVDLFLGGTPAASAMYATDGPAIINTGITVSKDLEVTDLFSLGLSGSVIANPYSDNLYMLFGVGF